MTLGTMIRKLRQGAHMSLDDLSKASGVSRSGICQIENEQRKSPGASTLDKLAKGLGLDSAAVFFDPSVRKCVQETEGESDVGKTG